MNLADERGGGGRGKSAIASVGFACLFVVAFVVVATGVGAALGPDGAGPAITESHAGAESNPRDASDRLQGTDVQLATQEEEEEDFPNPVGDWWGLDLEADEAPYIGLVQLGTVVLVIGAGGYAASKRYSLVPVRYRRRTLQVHEWMMLTGTALVAPHFVFAEEIEGLGLFLGLLLGIEVLSGFYGRHLHRRVLRRSRGDETPAVVGRILQTTNRRMLSRWRRIHITLVSITALALLVHILSEAL